MLFFYALFYLPSDSFAQTNTIRWEIKIVAEYQDTIRDFDNQKECIYPIKSLSFNFSAKKEAKFILSWYAFETIREKRSFWLTGFKARDLMQLLDSVPRFELVIENQDKILHFFSEPKFLNPCGRITVFDMGRSLETIRLPEYRKENKLTYRKEDLQINEWDTKVRLHYLFNPTKNEIKEGFKKTIITSNWINL